MSGKSFEQRIGRQLKAIPEAFTYHPPDDPRTRQWKPADFLVCLSGRLIAIECKEVASGNFPLSVWTPQQRLHCSLIRSSGAPYILIVNYPAHQTTRAYEPDPSVSRGSLSSDTGYLVTSTNLENVIRQMLFDYHGDTRIIEP